MPDGVVQWFDATAGEAAVVEGAEVLRAAAGEVEVDARCPGAQVHFDVARVGGVERAVRVRLLIVDLTEVHLPRQPRVEPHRPSR